MIKKGRFTLPRAILNGSTALNIRIGPITNIPDDLKGLDVRVPNVPAFVTTLECNWSKTHPMAFSEVFRSLSNGTTRKAQENPVRHWSILTRVSPSTRIPQLNWPCHKVGVPRCGWKSNFKKLPPDPNRKILLQGRQRKCRPMETFILFIKRKKTYKKN